MGHALFAQGDDVARLRALGHGDQLFAVDAVDHHLGAERGLLHGDLNLADEIVFDRSFLDALEKESPGLLDPDRLTSRTEELKGIGPWEGWVLPEGVGLKFDRVSSECFHFSPPT